MAHPALASIEVGQSPYLEEKLDTEGSLKVEALLHPEM